MSERFEEAYRKGAPWDTGRPQPVVSGWARDGDVAGIVLDVGCGTGENALHLAEQGFEVHALDIVESALTSARVKAAKQRLKVHFYHGDALDLPFTRPYFNTVVDSGVFHVFTDEERAVYLDNLQRVLHPEGIYLGVFFSDAEPEGWGPRRIRREEIDASFARGWRIEWVKSAHYEVVDTVESLEPGRARAWQVKAVWEGV